MLDRSGTRNWRGEARNWAVKHVSLIQHVRRPGLEPGTWGLAGTCSIHLSYRRVCRATGRSNGP
jgi:hypothetical protein